MFLGSPEISRSNESCNPAMVRSSRGDRVMLIVSQVINLNCFATGNICCKAGNQVCREAIALAGNGSPRSRDANLAACLLNA